jgi:hypothetical protein
MWGRRKAKAEPAATKLRPAAAAPPYGFRQAEIDIFLERRSDRLLTIAYFVTEDRDFAADRLAETAARLLGPDVESGDASPAHVVYAALCETLHRSPGLPSQRGGAADDLTADESVFWEVRWLWTLPKPVRLTLLLQLVGGLSHQEATECLPAGNARGDGELKKALAQLVAADPYLPPDADPRLVTSALELQCGLLPPRRASQRRAAVNATPAAARAYADAVLLLDRIATTAVREATLSVDG